MTNTRYFSEPATSTSLADQIDYQQLEAEGSAMADAYQSYFLTQAGNSSDVGMYPASYPIKGLMHLWQATTSDQTKYLDNAMALVDTTIATAVDPDPNPDAPPGPGYLGWPASYATQYQWALSVGQLAYAILRQYSQADPTHAAYVTWANNTLEWLDKNIIEKWWDYQTSGANQYVFLNNTRYHNAAVTRDNTNGDGWGFVNDKSLMSASLGVIMNAAYAIKGDGTGTTKTGVEYLTEWWKIYRDQLFDRGSQGMWDANNVNLRYGTVGGGSQGTAGQHPWPDTAHANRNPEMYWTYFDCARNGFNLSSVDPNAPEGPNLDDLRAMANLWIDNIWNGQASPNIRFHNYIDGDDTQYRDYLHGGSDPKGMASHSFYGWNWLGAVDKRINYAFHELWKYLDRGAKPGNSGDSGTYQRHNTREAHVCIVGGLLFNKKYNLWLG